MKSVSWVGGKVNEQNVKEEEAEQRRLSPNLVEI